MSDKRWRKSTERLSRLQRHEGVGEDGQACGLTDRGFGRCNKAERLTVLPEAGFNREMLGMNGSQCNSSAEDPSLIPDIRTQSINIQQGLVFVFLDSTQYTRTSTRASAQYTNVN